MLLENRGGRKDRTGKMAAILKVSKFNTILDEQARQLYAPAITTVFALAPETMKRKNSAANVQYGFMLATVLELCRDFPRTKILCVGSYEDTALESLLKIGVRAEGIDPNVDGVDLDKFLSLYPDRRGTYDIVFSTSVLEHVEHDEAFVSGIASLIAPGGYGVFTCDFRSAWKAGEPVPQADFRFYRSDDLSGRLLRAMRGCDLLDAPDWDAFEPDFEYEGCKYNFATFTVQKGRVS
jgi:SAM-dependent methyltransferase